jgi:hypothetical protein
MGKLINMGRAWFRLRMGIFDGETEEDAERMRRYIEWKRLSRGGSLALDQLPTLPKPPVPPGSKVQLKVVPCRRADGEA